MRRAWEPRKGRSPVPQGASPLDLAYTVEHWSGAPKSKVRVIGRAAELGVAEAIFEAAAREYRPGVLLLKQGDTVLRRNTR